MSQSELPKPLSEEEARQLAEHLAVLTKSGLPLSPALRAAAAEIPNRRLSLAMSILAKEMEAGKSLDQVLAANPRLLPPHMQRLIETGVRSGNLPDVLVRLVDLDRTSADLRRSIRGAVAYPLLLITLWLMLVAFLALYVMPDLGKVYHDFHTNLPLPTVWLMKLSGDWPWRAFAFFLAAVPMIIVGLRVSLRPLGWQRLLTHIPLIGRTLLWRGVANWSRLLSLLLRQQIPLPEATKLAADGAYAPIMSVQGFRLTRMVESGRKLSDSLANIRSLPASLAPIVRWGEDHGALPEALETAADMFESRVQMRATLLQSILPPAVFVFIALGALGLANAIIMPMVGLMWNLTGLSWRRRRIQSPADNPAQGGTSSALDRGRGFGGVGGDVDRDFAARHTGGTAVRWTDKLLAAANTAVEIAFLRPVPLGIHFADAGDSASGDAGDRRTVRFVVVDGHGGDRADDQSSRRRHGASQFVLVAGRGDRKRNFAAGSRTGFCRRAP